VTVTAPSRNPPAIVTFRDKKNSLTGIYGRAIYVLPNINYY